MKILVITPSYKPAYIYGGTIFAIAESCEWLHRAGNDVTVITTTANGEEELSVNVGSFQNVNGVSVIYFKRNTKDHSHLSIELIKYLFSNSKKYDVIHINSWWNMVTILSLIICRMKGIIPVISPHGMLSPYTFSKSVLRNLFHKYIGSYLLGKTIFHVTSNSEKNECDEVVDPLKYFMIPNYVKVSPEFQSRNISDNGKMYNLIFLSRIHPKKGLELTFSILSNLKINWNLKIAGDGDYDYINQLKKLSIELGIENKLEWLGQVEGNRKFKLLSDSDLLILLSKSENFAIVVVESLSVGTPVFLSNEVGLASYISENEFGWIVDKDDDIVSKLTEALFDYEKRSLITKTAPEKTKSDFYSDKLTDQYEKMYLEVKKLND